jgi:RNA polymerase sigma-70 factor (ECF subfamily)
MNAIHLHIKDLKKRCSEQYGMNPNELPVPKQYICEDVLRKKQARANQLLNQNENNVKHVLQEIRGIPFVLLLTDDEGNVVKIHSDETMKERSTAIGIREGVQFRENDVGVNSISIALDTGQTTELIGNDHFHYCLYDSACLSIPFTFAPSVTGTLSLMTHKDLMNEDINRILITSLKKAAANNTTADFYEKYHHDIFRYLRSLSRDEELAKDLCQQTFLAVFNHIDSFQQKGSPKSWIYRIAFHTFISWYRRETKMTFINIENTEANLCQSTFKDPDQFIEEMANYDEIEGYISKLKPQQQTVIWLREFNQLSYQEISNITGWSIPKIKTMLHRARKNLQQRMCGATS